MFVKVKHFCAWKKVQCAENTKEKGAVTIRIQFTTAVGIYNSSTKIQAQFFLPRQNFNFFQFENMCRQQAKWG